MGESKTKRRWRPTPLQLRASEKGRCQADREAARIPWQSLLKTRRDYIRWQAYLLWVRAIEEAETDFPLWLAEMVERRARGYLHYAAHYGFCHRHTPQPDTSWRLLEEWINEHIFRTPWNEGWMFAVGYYAVRDLASLRDDAYAEWCVENWKSPKPASFPCFREWRRASEQVTDGILDQVEMREDRRDLIKRMRRVRPRSLQLAVDRYVAWKLFALWARVALEECSRLQGTVNHELQTRCPGFLEEYGPAREHPRIFDALIRWIEDHYFNRAKKEGWFKVLLYEAELHPRHTRAKDYWIRGEYEWTRKGRRGYPVLDRWIRALDGYTFEPAG